MCSTCENNELYQNKNKKRKNAFHNAFHVPILFFLFFLPEKSGITKIKDIKDVLGDVCSVYMIFMVLVDVHKNIEMEGEEQEPEEKEMGGG